MARGDRLPRRQTATDRALRSVLGLALWIGSVLPASGQPQGGVPAETAQGSSVLATAQTLLRVHNAAAAATLLEDALLRAAPTMQVGEKRELTYWLGEALYRQGELHGAQRVFLAYVEGPVEDAQRKQVGQALKRLVELATALHSDEGTGELMARLTALAAEDRPEGGEYAMGRYLFLRKRYGEARARLEREASGNGTYALRAKYLRAAALSAEGNLGDAEREFQAVVDGPLPDSDDDRRVRELSHMALGRIYHARGDSTQAYAAYLQISQRSSLFRDALYEASWASIRAKDFTHAEQALTLLLLAYRDAQETTYAALEAKVLLGNLLLRRGELAAALGWFEQAKSEVSPTVQALRERMTQTGMAQAIEKLQQDPQGFRLAAIMPPAALSLLQEDDEVARFVRVQQSLRTLRAVLAENERAVASLDRRLLSLQGDRSSEDLRAALHREREEQRLLLQQQEATGREAVALGESLLLAAVEATQKKFSELELRAIAGTLDVAWANKQAHSEKIAALSMDLKREQRLLDEDFAKPSEPLSALPVPKDAPKDIQEDIARYHEAGEAMRRTLAELGKEVYQHRRSELGEQAAGRMAEEEREERASRLQAIAQFEQFLAQKPTHPRFAPDAMFRLAELYFERASEAFAKSVQANKTDADQGSTDSATPDYGPSIALYQRLLREYPRYRKSDGVAYLLGYCQGEMGREAEARQALLSLVCTNRFATLDAPAPWPGRKAPETIYEGCQPQFKDSSFLAESWTRLGEQHFDRDELSAAIAAYGQVLPFADSPFYDKALYKLAWSLYRNDRFAEAVKRFDQLVLFADKKSGAPRRPTEPVPKEGSSLRSEAIQYLALSFAERDWDGDGRLDGESGLARLEKFYDGRQREPHVREIVVRLGDILSERTEYGRAAEIYQRAIGLSPLASDNPSLQQKVAQAFDRQRSFEQALRAREALAKDYAAGSPWYEANRDDAGAIATATELADASLVAAITNRHASAQALRQRALKERDGKLAEKARQEYRQAAESYATFLKQHPGAKKAYEYLYLWAEALYYGGEFAGAAAAYARVRDADGKGAHLEDAAFGAVRAQEHQALRILRGTESGKQEQVLTELDPDEDIGRALSLVLPALPVLGKTSPPTSAPALPEVIGDLQATYDKFVSLLPQTERAALFAYKSAELDFRYLRFERARSRFTAVLDRYCQSERAVDAGNAILVTHTIEGNLDQVESWTGRIQNKGCGGQSTLASQQRENLKKLSEDVSFKKAEQLMEGKRYEAAAAMFLSIVEKSPRAQSADKALYNAGVSYEQLAKAALAAATFERLGREYPGSALVEQALFRSAMNHQKLLAFDRALFAYRALATLPRFAKSPHRRDALFNAALLADRDGDLAAGRELWRLYENDPQSTPEEGRQAAFRVAVLTDRMNEPLRAQEEWGRYLRKIGSAVPSDEQGLLQVVEAHHRLGRAQEAVRNPIDAGQSYASAAKLGLRLPAGSVGAEPAAHAAFLLAERRLLEIEKLKISGGGDELQASIGKYKQAVALGVAEYEKVLGYRRATWMLASYYRMGYLFELFAKALLGAPCPAEVKKLGEGACELYRTKIEESVAQIEDQAVSRYVVALDQAAKLGVSSVWTRETRSRLSAYRPDKYPSRHEDRVAQGLSLGGIMPVGDGGSSSQGRALAEAKTALGRGQPESALVLARQVLAENDRSAAAMLVMAQAYYQLGKLDLAAAVIGVAQEQLEQTGATSGEQAAESQLLLGLIGLGKTGQRGEGDVVAATAAFKRASELDPRSGLAWHNLGAQYLLAKNYVLALPAVQRAAGLLPSASAVQLNLGVALRGAGQTSEALEVFKQVLSRDPQDADAEWNLAVLYLDTPNLPTLDPLTQKKAAVERLQHYQDLTHGRRDELLEAYLKEGRAAVEREERKQQRQRTGGQKP